MLQQHFLNPPPLVPLLAAHWAVDMEIHLSALLQWAQNPSMEVLEPCYC